MKFASLAIVIVLSAVVVVCDSTAIKANHISSLSVVGEKVSRVGEAVSSSSVGDEVSSSRGLLVYRGIFQRNAAWNTVQVHNQSWRGNWRITSVRVFEIGVSQGATARITAGGVGSNHVTVQMRSLISRGFKMQLEIYGF